MSLWKTLFGGDTSIGKVTDGIYNGVDKAFYTDEERSTHFPTLLKAYEPFKIAQRLIALALVGTYLLGFICCSFLLVWSGFVGAPLGTDLSQAAYTLGGLLNDALSVPVGLVVGFYFGGGMAEGVIEKFAQKRKLES